MNPGQSVTNAFALGLFVVMWNYLGWDGVSTVAEEMHNPQRDYPKMLLITVPLITAVYFLPTVAGLAAAGTEDIEWTAGAFTVIAEAVAGPWLGTLHGGGRPDRLRRALLQPSVDDQPGAFRDE